MARPTRVEARWRWPRPTMSLQLSRCWCPDWVPGEQARKVSNPRPSVLETAAPPLARAPGRCAHDVVRVVRRTCWRASWASALPAHDGPAGIGRLPSSRLTLEVGVVAGRARERADARQGVALRRSFGDACACH